MLSAVIITHAHLAEALLDAVQSVAGDVSQIETVSNDGLSIQQIETRVCEALDRSSQEGCIVFADLSGGSCALGSQLALRDHPQARLLTGVNMAMLVDFVLRRKDHDLDAMVERLLQRGRSSVRELPRAGEKET